MSDVLGREPEPILEVLEITKFDQSASGLAIEAQGLTRTTGWTQPMLVARRYVQPPQDGIQEFDFLALRPAGGSGDALRKITGEGKLEERPDWLRGVRVIAETNSRERLVGELEGKSDRAALKEQYQQQLERAKTDAANSSDVHTIATFIALSDARVESLVVDYLAKGHPFIGFEYPVSPDFELVSVVFKFACKVGTICIKPPHFVAFVNLITQRVKKILDPFNGSVSSRLLSNSTEKELYIVVRRTGYDGPCIVLPSDAYYLGIYTFIFGPASREACEAFAKRNCGRSPE